VLAGSAAVLLVSLGVIFWVVASLDSQRLLAYVTGQLSARLGRPVAASRFEVSIPEGEFTLHGLQIGREPMAIGPAPPAFSIERVRGRLSWRSFVPARFHLESLDIEGVYLWGLDDGGKPRPESAPLGPAIEAVATRLSFTSNRMSVSGTTIGYRNRPTPWETRADDVAVSLRTGEEGGVDAEIRSGWGVIRLWERPDLPMALSADVRVRGNDLHFDFLELRSELLEVRFEGTMDMANDLDGRLTMVGGGDAGELGRFLFEFEGIDTAGNPWLQFDGTAGFQENGLGIDGEFVLPEARFYGVPLRDWRGIVHWDPERVEILASEGFASEGLANLQLLQVQPREDNPARILFSVRGGALAPAFEGLFGTPTSLRSQVTLDADLRLPFADPGRMTGTIQATGLKPEEAAPGALPLGFETDLLMDDTAMEIRRLVLEGEAFRSTINGHYPRSGDASIAGSALAGESAEADAVQQEIRRVLFGEDPETTAWDVAGAGAFEGIVRGRWPDLVLEGEVEGQMMRFSTIHTETLIATGRIERDAIHLDTLNARFGEGLISASGVFDRASVEYPDMEFNATWDGWNAREIIDFLEWDLEADGIVAGRSHTVRRDERYTGGGSVLGADGHVLEQPFDEVSITWNMDGDTARLAPMSGVFRDGTAEGTLDVGLVDWEMDGALTGKDYPLTPGLAPEWISIRSDFRLDVGGDLLVPELRLEARVPNAAVLGLSLGPGDITGSVHGEDFEGSGVLDSGAASFRMAGRAPLGTDGAGTVTMRGVDVAPILFDAPGERGVSIVVGGSGDFHIEDPLDEWMTGRATLETLRVAAPDFVAESGGPTTVRLEDARVHIEDLRLLHADSQLALAGSIGLDDQLLDISLLGQTSLLAAAPFVPWLAADGEFGLEAAVVGPWTEPEVLGTGTIRDGSFRVEGFPHALSDVEGAVDFDQRTLRIAEVIGRMGGGDAIVSGSISVEDTEFAATDLRVQLSDASLRYPSDLSATVDADLRLLGDQSGRLLTGEVRLDQAVWSREYELFASILADVNSVARPAETEPSGFLDELRMDIRVETDSPFAVRNSIFQLDAAANFGLRGTAGSPAVLGRADLVGGEVYFGAHRFQIVEGRADFIDPEGIEPVFDIEAETSVRSYRVRLAASGTAEQIDANLSSEPPLREADILRLLSGAPEQDLLTAASDDELAAASAASLLSQQLSNMIGRRAGRVFGIDRVSIDPFMIGRFSNPTARVTLGKQVTQDLNVRYSSSLSDAEESIIVVEYTPSGPVSWIFSRDQDGSLGVDVRFHRSF
jgi:hypothetical protein